MRILVTGGAGFLGSHLCSRLVNEGHDVICSDNLYTGNLNNIKNLLDLDNFTFVNTDISKPLVGVDYPSSIFYDKLDQIYNLACPASPPHYQKDPIFTTKTSIIGTLHMLDLAKDTGAKFLQASTSEVYGDPNIHPQPETYWGNVNPIGIRSCYDNKTEILTNDGWKLFKDLTNDNTVATYENGILKYYKPDEIIKEKYFGNMYHFNNSKYDILVTPNHKMIRITRSGILSFDEASCKVDWAHSKFISGCQNNIDDIHDISYFDIDLNCKVDDWLTFFGHYLADGCVYIRNHIKTVNEKEYDVTDYKIILTHGKNKNKINLYKQSFENIGLNWHNLNDHQIMVTNKKLCLHLSKIGKALQKFIPKKYLKLNNRQSKILLYSMIDGDGTKKKNSFTYYTGSNQLKDDIQILILNSGMSSSYKFYEQHGGFNGSKGCYHIYGRENINPICVAPKLIQYYGYVYCVNVKNHIVCTRRNGKVVFCGNCYDEGKRAAETLCFDFKRQYNVDTKVARIFNTYGPNMDINDGRVISNFVTQALKNKPMTMYGDGQHSRSFQYVDDLIDGMIKLMNSDKTGPYNIGNPDEFTMLELANIVIEMTNSKSKFVYRDLPKDDPKMRKPDISKALKDLGWSPKIDLRTGLKYTIKYFENALRIT